MIRKIISCLASCALAIMAFAEVDSLKMRVVPLSSVQWVSIQNQMNTNGWCRIKEQNVVLVITNGCPNVEHWFPIGRGPNKKKKVEPSPEPSPEPSSYIGQSMIVR